MKREGRVFREIRILTILRRDQDGTERYWKTPMLSFQEKPLSDEDNEPVPQTDTGRQVENTKALERTRVKELGKLTP